MGELCVFVKVYPYFIRIYHKCDGTEAGQAGGQAWFLYGWLNIISGEKIWVKKITNEKNGWEKKI